jgi:NADH-quinone oxidoreductase subunit B
MGIEFYSSQKLQDLLGWARKYSMFKQPFITACCAMEYMATMGPRYDLSRFGSEFVQFTPRHTDLLFVVGTVTERQAPVLRRVYDQMADPKWVVAFGVCASSGGFYQNYAVVPGIDQIVPVDVYIPGCPPRPEQVLDGIVRLQEMIQAGETHSQRALRRLAQGRQGAAGG